MIVESPVRGRCRGRILLIEGDLPGSGSVRRLSDILQGRSFRTSSCPAPEVTTAASALTPDLIVVVGAALEADGVPPLLLRLTREPGSRRPPLVVFLTRGERWIRRHQDSLSAVLIPQPLLVSVQAQVVEQFFPCGHRWMGDCEGWPGMARDPVDADPRRHM